MLLSTFQGRDVPQVQEIILVEKEGVQCHTLTDIIVHDGNLNNPLSNTFALNLISLSPILEVTQPRDLFVYVIDSDSKFDSFVVCS